VANSCLTKGLFTNPPDSPDKLFGPPLAGLPIFKLVLKNKSQGLNTKVLVVIPYPHSPTFLLINLRIQLYRLVPDFSNYGTENMFALKLI